MEDTFENASFENDQWRLTRARCREDKSLKQWQQDRKNYLESLPEAERLRQQTCTEKRLTLINLLCKNKAPLPAGLLPGKNGTLCQDDKNCDVPEHRMIFQLLDELYGERGQQPSCYI